MKIKEATRRLVNHIHALSSNRYCKQREFALQVSMDDSNLSKLLRHSDRITLHTFFRLCRGLRMHPWEVMSIALREYFDFTETNDRGWEFE